MSFGPLLAPESLALLPPDSLRILDVRPEAAYLGGHLPGALRVDRERDLSTALEADFDPTRGGRHPLPPHEAWKACWTDWGLHPGLPVLVYDEAANGDGAARLWWMLRASGHTQVALLDGGLKTYGAAGLPLSTEPVQPPGGGSLEPLPDWPRMPRVDLGAIESMRQDPSRRVVDVRATERWRGEVEPFDPIPGRIPGTRNLPWAGNLAEDGRMKPPEALRRVFLEALEGIPPERVAVHCGSGVTACHTLFALELAGLPGASLYVGSYSEWCRNRQTLRG